MRRWRTDGLAGLYRLALALSVGALVWGFCAGLAEQPSSVTSSFSPEKLERVSDYMRNEVATGKIPGAIVLIEQHGRPVYYEKFGVRSIEGRQPMTEDTIF